MKIYIGGSITNNPNYKEQFRRCQEHLESQGHIVLNPAMLPQGMNPGEYMKICFAMIDVSDEAHFMDGWEWSDGANLEHDYCVYCEKTIRLGSGF
ncbi:MAG: DUF4406 domain-containing protein [Eubacteriaceae bacterium]|nr:DUF4406 domain-containing protein [Eubacteriaceae bacterium]